MAIEIKEYEHYVPVVDANKKTTIKETVKKPVITKPETKNNTKK